MRRLSFLAAVAFATIVTAAPGHGSDDGVYAVFPGADQIGAFSGEPAAAEVFAEGERIGYVLSTADVVGSTGYGGDVIDVLVGVEAGGRITGARLRRHNEPILVIGVSETDLLAYVAGFAGMNVLHADRSERRGGPDAIAGATVSSAVILDAVVRSARAVLRARAPGSASRRLRRRPFEALSWDVLLSEGSVRRARVTFADVRRALGGIESPSGADDDPFIEVFTALLTPPRIGGNVLGERQHQQLMSSIGADDHAILIAANGFYSFKGRAYRKTGLFDRVQVVQGERTFRLTQDAHENVPRIKAEAAPELREAGRFILPGDAGFDADMPWRVEVFVRQETADGGIRQAVFAFDYALPDAYLEAAQTSVSPPTDDPSQSPLWLSVWQDRSGSVIGVAVLLAVLTAVLVFQDALVRYRRFRDVGRLAFLAVVLVWLGWIAGGQLSVIQVLAFAHAFMTGFEWRYFLIDPVIFVLWSYVAVTLLFWGRGVYCGWLCPFGALQELSNALARYLRVPQIKVPFALHERLWALKYIIFIALFALSLHSMRNATVAAEVEPFKTAVTLMFVRSWPFVLYAVGLLVVGLFVERFFCRYLCPLGGALAIPARLRMFNWLKRHHQCGRECQLCAERCTVQAIHPTGEINPNECIHCLECQTYYWDDRLCPPLIARRKRRERREALSAGAGAESDA